MKFVVLHILIQTEELEGIQAKIIENGNVICDLNIQNNDPTQVVRSLSQELIRNNFPTKNGRIVFIGFGILENLEPLMNSQTFCKYLQFDGGIHNPSTLFFDGQYMPTLADLTPRKGIDGLMDVLTRFYKLKTN